MHICPACQTGFTAHACPTCGALTDDSAWRRMWAEDYDFRSPDPAVHAAHQIHVAETILSAPDEHPRDKVVWARTVLCS